MGFWTKLCHFSVVLKLIEACKAACMVSDISESKNLQQINQLRYFLRSKI